MRSIVIIGAGGGVGLELVKQLIRHKYRSPEVMIATCICKEYSVELAKLEKTHPNLHVFELALLNHEGYTEFAEKVSELVGEQGLNVLFLNTNYRGYKTAGLISACARNMMVHFKINTVAPILITQALVPLLRKASQVFSKKPVGIERAAIFYMSSLLGSIGDNKGGRFWGYRESKAAAHMALRTMTVEFFKDGIATLILVPGDKEEKLPDGSIVKKTFKSCVMGLLPLIFNLNDQTSGCYLRPEGTEVCW